jgi:importin subunit alpha-1
MASASHKQRVRSLERRGKEAVLAAAVEEKRAVSGGEPDGEHGSATLVAARRSLERVRSRLSLQLRWLQREDAGRARERLEDDEPLLEAGSPLPAASSLRSPRRRGAGAGAGAGLGVDEFAAMLASEEVGRQLAGARGLRRLLQRGKGQPAQRVVLSGALPRLVELLERDDVPRLQLECCLALTNVAGGSSAQTRAVVEAGAVPALVRMMRDGDESVRDQPVWALGNVAGDCAEHRDLVLAHGALEVLVDDIMAPWRFASGGGLAAAGADPAASGGIAAGDSALEHATWAVLNLLRVRPLPLFSRCRLALPRLCQLLHHERSPEVMRDACWALAAISESTGAAGCVRALLDLGVVRRCVQLLGKPPGELTKPALRVVGNACAGEHDAETQEVVDTGVVPVLGRLAAAEDAVTRREVFWTLANIVAGGPRQVEAVCFEHAPIMPLIVRAALEDSSEVAREAVWALANSTAGSANQVCRLVTRHGCVRALGECLRVHRDDAVALSVALEGLENLIRVFVAENADAANDAIFVAQVKQCALVEALRELRDAPEQQVADIAGRILAKGGVEEMVLV